jgi:hypothetical protein
VFETLFFPSCFPLLFEFPVPLAAGCGTELLRPAALRGHRDVTRAALALAPLDACHVRRREQVSQQERHKLQHRSPHAEHIRARCAVVTQTKPPELTLEAFLVVGKASGACGILTQQLQFQESTQMAGGNEFVVRFWTTEAARLGMTMQQYVEHCTSTLSSYAKLSEMAESAQR